MDCSLLLQARRRRVEPAGDLALEIVEILIDALTHPLADRIEGRKALADRPAKILADGGEGVDRKSVV